MFGETRSYNGISYVPLLASAFSGGTLDLEGGNITASLVFAGNELDLVVFKQAADESLASTKSVRSGSDP